jgi:signal transduction histidine kinase
VSYTLSPVDENIKDMEQFIYNAGHELRTPLAVVKSSLQLAKIKKDATVDINTSISEINKMSSLIQSLMSLSTIKEVSNTSKVNINKIVNEDIKQRDEEIKNKEIKITLKENHKLDLNTNEEYFNILFSNILSNAIKYNKQ